ncbi:hypothetical protein ACFFX0_08445 [Citricoccus parietis]|uniref:Uncharacterized protein n=1 Tax=Citricoccus parietis TaxID=592307 RepID=A0ABV5FX16_9MICC
MVVRGVISVVFLDTTEELRPRGSPPRNCRSTGHPIGVFRDMRPTLVDVRPHVRSRPSFLSVVSTLRCDGA